MREIFREAKIVFVTLIDLEKTYDTVDKQPMREVLMMYGVGGKILGAIKSNTRF
jgi:hypothetical protein